VKSDILTRLLYRLSEKLPDDVSVGFPWGIAVEPKTFAEHLLKEVAPDERVEIKRQLADLKLHLVDSFKDLQSELKVVGVRGEKQYRDLLVAVEHILRRVELLSCFLP